MSDTTTHYEVLYREVGFPIWESEGYTMDDCPHYETQEKANEVAKRYVTQNRFHVPGSRVIYEAMVQRVTIRIDELDFFPNAETR